MGTLMLGALLLIGCRPEMSAPQYVSFAQMKVAAGELSAEARADPDGYREYLADFYGTTLETLEGPVLHKRTEDRVGSLNPNLKPCEVTVRVTQVKNSTIFDVAAFGTNPKYIPVFLDALVDEFRVFREEVREQLQTKALTKLAAVAVKVEAAVKDTHEALTSFNAKLAHQVDSSGQQSQIPAALLQQRDRLQHQFAESERAHKAMAELVHHFQGSELPIGAYVVIMKPASPAVEHVRP
jgi:hypothetical protein